jgi:hypothetical protein
MDQPEKTTTLHLLMQASQVHARRHTMYLFGSWKQTYLAQQEDCSLN